MFYCINNITVSVFLFLCLLHAHTQSKSRGVEEGKEDSGDGKAGGEEEAMEEAIAWSAFLQPAPLSTPHPTA
jgi:hypothetical protein